MIFVFADFGRGPVCVARRSCANGVRKNRDRDEAPRAEWWWVVEANTPEDARDTILAVGSGRDRNGYRRAEYWNGPRWIGSLLESERGTGDPRAVPLPAAPRPRCEYPGCRRRSTHGDDGGAAGVTHYCERHDTCACGEFMVERGRFFIGDPADLSDTTLGRHSIEVCTGLPGGDRARAKEAS